MTARKRVIAMLVAVFMVLAMMPMVAQEAYATTEVIVGDVVVGEYVTIDISKYTKNSTANVYVYKSSDEEWKETFTWRGSGTTIYSWKVPYDWQLVGESLCFVVETGGEKFYSKSIKAKMRLNNLDLSDMVPDLTYTGKAVTHKNFELDFGENYYYKSYFTVSYSNNLKVGKASITFKAKANSDFIGSKTAYFKIRPKGATIKAPKKGKKAFTAKWKKQTAKMNKSRITGYQVQYSTDKNFSTYKTKNVKGYKKTSKKITGLKKKTTYYVRVRTYMKVGSSYYYSTWSKTKSVKTK